MRKMSSNTVKILFLTFLTATAARAVDPEPAYDGLLESNADLLGTAGQSEKAVTDLGAISPEEAADLAATVGAGASSDGDYDPECAIWLCLPAGFPMPHCDKALDAFERRIRKMEPPLPAFASCADDDDGAWRYDYKEAAYIPPRNNGGTEKYVPDTYCKHTNSGGVPKGCTETGHYIDVYNEDALQGERYYFLIKY